MATSSSSTYFGDNSNNYYLSEDTGIDTTTDPISSIGWFYLDNTPGTAATICSQDQGTGTGKESLVSVESTRKYASFFGGGNIQSTTLVVLDTWSFGAQVFAGATGTNRIYLNNVDEANASKTGKSAGNIFLGSSIIFSFLPWDGLLSFNQIYNIVLSADQIQELSHNPFAFPDNLQWFPDLLDTTAASFRDLSPQQRGSPTISGSLSTSQSGPPVFFQGGQ